MSFSVFEETKSWAQKAKIHLHASETVSSTNALAKEAAVAQAAGEVHLFLCDHQTAGRGRGDHSWVDTGQGSSLLSSWSISLPFFPQPILAPAMGLAVFRALKATWFDTKFGLKPPNDIYCKEKKIAGILLETVQQGNSVRLILGLGLNVFQAPEVETAGSLSDAIDDNRITPMIFASFLDRLLLEIVTTLAESPRELSANQRELLAFAINQYAPKKMIKTVLPDGSLALIGGSRVSWQTL